MFIKSLFIASMLSIAVASSDYSLGNTPQAPDTTADASFQPKTLMKLAVIVAGANEGARPGFGMRADDQVQTNRQRLVEDAFVQTLLDLGHVVVARSDLKSILKEQSLGQSGLTDSDTVAVGKLLNVPAVLVVRITDCATERQRAGRNTPQTVEGKATISARLVSVETGTIWWLGKHTLKEPLGTESQIQVLLGKTSVQLAKAFPAKATEKLATFEPGKITKLALVMEASPRQSAGFGQRGESNPTQDVEDELSLLLGKKGYTLVSRTELQTLVKEKQFQASGLTEENVKVFGKLLNVPVVLVVRITDSSAQTAMRNQSMTTAAVGARLVSVESGEVLWCKTYIDSQKTGSKLDHSEVMAKAARKVGEQFPKRE